MLKPRVRNIPENTIKSKWTALPESVQDRVNELFRAVELPVITRSRDERKRIEAQAALAAVKKKYVYSDWIIARFSMCCWAIAQFVCQQWANDKSENEA